MAEHCAVADDNCLDPAGFGIAGYGYAASRGSGKTRACCMRCGDAVCANCRTGKRGKWICNNCNEHMTGGSVR